MEDATKYGSSTVLMTSITSVDEKGSEGDVFPCVSPLDDGKSALQIVVGK